MLPMIVYGAFALGLAALPFVIPFALSSKAPLRRQARWHLVILFAGVVFPFVLPAVVGGFEYVLIPVASLTVTVMYAIRLKGQRFNSAALGFAMTIGVIPMTAVAVMVANYPG